MAVASDRFKGREVQAALLLALAALILVVLARKLFAAGKGNVVLILGASGSGKTTLFHQLRDGTAHHGTLPSMQPNQDTVQLKLEKENVGKRAKTVELVDIPGHPRVRGKAADYYGRARSIIFLVDAADFMGQKTEVAEQLYEVLADPTVQSQRPRLLLVCNKSDLGAKAHTGEFVRKRLEREIEALKGTRTTLGEAAGQTLSVARKADVFSFSNLKSPRVSFATASALTNDVQEIVALLQ